MKNFLSFFALIVVSSSLFSQEKLKSLDRVNLGENINTKYTEITPKISADGKVIYFVREGHPKNKHLQDIWYSKKSENGEWTEAKRADKTLNRVDGNCVWAVNADGNTVLIRGAFKDGEYIGRGFSITRLTENGWTNPEMVVIEGLEYLDHGDNDGISMSLHANALVLTMSEKAASKNYDLYISTRKSDNTFTKPIKLENVNSDYVEFAPFLAPDNRTLFFSSDRPGGLGQTDIYKSERLDSTWTNWSEPVNLGAPINTPAKDGYYVTDAKGQFGFVVSEENSIGGADIEQIKINKAQMSKPVVMVDGRIYNAKTKKLIRATINYSLYPDEADQGIVHTDHVSGFYKFALPYGNNYVVNVSAKGFVPYYDTISLPASGNYQEIRRDYYMVPIEVGQTVVLKHIYYETGKYDLLPSSYYQLNKIVGLLKSDARMEIEISGHTDDVGEDKDNRALSEARAKSVVNYLVSNGISGTRLKVASYGEKKPIMPNINDVSRQANRRVEFMITKK